VTNWDISTADAIERNTGWDLPLQALPYWLKGLPAPDVRIQALELDPGGSLLSKLQQDGWLVLFERYKQFGDISLPTKLRIQRGTTTARVIIRDWQGLSA
jgi:outer membrane lipoprotein LolB